MTRILIVEDMPDALGAYEMALRLAGYTVVGISEPETVAPLYGAMKESGTPFSLVILDLALPGINGFDVMTRLRRIDEDAPIAIFTAFDDPFTKGRSDAANTLGVWKKPLTGQELTQKVKEVLEK